MKEFLKEKYVLPEIKVDIVENDIITFSEDDTSFDYDFPMVGEDE